MKKLIMNRGIIIAIIIFIAVGTYAQQTAMYSQYFFNNYAYNPAVGGTQNTVDVSSNHRYQWVGLTDAPRTYTLTVQGPTKNRKMGIGAKLFTDHVGPTRQTGLQFSYSYIFKINEKIRLSLALSAGILEWKVDAHKINLYSAGDQVLVNSVMRTLVPDASFGFHLFHDNWYFGASAPNLLQSKLTFSNTQNTNQSRQEAHLYVNGGYRFQLSDDFQLEPGVMVKYVNPAPIQFDPMLRLIWKDQLWIGGVYRTMDAASAMIGFNYAKNLAIGYSYDFTMTNLRNYSSGTHELMLSVKFVKKQSFKGSKNDKASFE
jgi:type IX secretion system PorP/SprF family membrane protein